MTRKHFFCFLLVIIFTVCAVHTTSADSFENETDIPTGIASNNKYYSDLFYIINSDTSRASFTLTPSLTISSPSANKIRVIARAYTNVTVDKLGFSSLYIQKWNGSSWVNVASWYNQYKTNASSFIFTGSITGASTGSYYRAVCSFYAEKSGEIVTATATTSYIQCK